MKPVRTLLGFGVMAASVAVLRNRRRAAQRGALDDDVRFDNQVGTSVPANENLAAPVPANENLAAPVPTNSLADVAKHSGIADVDPEPLSHVAGEGIDPESDVRAHETVKEQRDRLPT